MGNSIKNIVLYDGSITEYDSRLQGFDIGTCLEVRFFFLFGLSLSPEGGLHIGDRAHGGRASSAIWPRGAGLILP